MKEDKLALEQIAKKLASQARLIRSRYTHMLPGETRDRYDRKNAVVLNQRGGVGAGGGGEDHRDLMISPPLASNLDSFTDIALPIPMTAAAYNRIVLSSSPSSSSSSSSSLESKDSATARHMKHEHVTARAAQRLALGGVRLRTNTSHRSSRLEH